MTQDNEVKIGKFKPKRPFLNFVAAVNGAKVRLISDFAFIKGEKLSGILEGTKFKFTLRDNGTLDVEEIGSSKSDDAMIKRLIDDIDTTDVTGFAHKFVVHGLEFEGEKGERYYLEVEHQKPIDKLKSLFDEPEPPQLSDNALSFLDDLLSISKDEIEEEVIEEEHAETENDIVEVKEEKVHALSYMEESFRKMNEQKVNELKSRIEEAEKNILKFKRDIQQSERSINSETDRLSVLQTRLDSFNVNEESTGYVFQVSDAKQSERELNDIEKALLSDVARLIKADENMLTRLLSNAMYVIKLAKKDNFEDKTLSREAFERLKQIDLNGTYSVNADGNIEYRGKFTWHQVVDKLIKKGFEQDADFEKFAGSNSYEVAKPDLTEEDSNIVDLGNGVYGVLPTNTSEDETNDSKLKNTKFAQKDYRTFTQPTDLVILGTLDASEESDIEITDDFVSLQIRVDSKPVKSIETDGFASIVTVDEYKKWHKEMVKQGSLDGTENDSYFGIDAVLVQGFQGTIGIGVYSEKLGYVTDFDESSFIHHEEQFNGDYPDVFINFDGEVTMHDIKGHDLTKIVKY